MSNVVIGQPAQIKITDEMVINESGTDVVFNWFDE